jgi:hypothetical protein
MKTRITKLFNALLVLNLFFAVSVTNAQYKPIDPLKFKKKTSEEIKEIIKSNRSSAAAASGIPQDRKVLSWDDNMQNWDTTSKEVFTYLAGTHLVASKTTLTLDFNGSYSNSSRITYKYNQNHKLLESLEEFWAGNNWTPSTKNTFVYDSKGNLTLDAYLWANGNTWDTIQANRFTYTYNSAGLKTSMVDTYFDSMDGWVEMRKYLFEYNTSNHLIKQIEQEKTGNTWTNSMKEEYTVSANGQWTEVAYFTWENGAWTNDGAIMRNIEWQNFAERKYKKYTISMEFIGTFMDFMRYTATYHSNGEMTSELFEMKFGGAWENMSRSIQEFDNKNNLTLLKFDWWNNNSWETNYAEKREYVYQNNNVSTETHSFFDSFSNTWLNSVRFVYGPYTSTVGLQAITTEKTFTVYPNPVRNIITVDGVENSRIEVINIAGQVMEVTSASANESAKIDMSGFDNGVYFLRVSSKDGKATTKKIIKQ